MTAIDFLLQSQNADGGWGYRVGGMSYVEPTAAVMLAIADATARNRARDFLLALQRADGGWGIAAIDDASGWMTAWAVRALAGFADARAQVERGAQWLIGATTWRIDDPSALASTRKLFQIDATLRGWAWQAGDAAWVHPTALAMLALVAAGWRGDARVAEGVRYLYDRAVPTGGWNIGNPWMLDQQIPATIQDTAIALLALRAVDEPGNDPHVASAIVFLRDAVARARTPAELAWGIAALREWSEDTRDATLRLRALQNEDGSWNGNPFITATAANQK